MLLFRCCIENVGNLVRAEILPELQKIKVKGVLPVKIGFKAVVKADAGSKHGGRHNESQANSKNNQAMVITAKGNPLEKPAYGFHKRAVSAMILHGIFLLI
jgi:hypothetical protein